MGKPRPIDAIAIAMMIILCLSWAFQQIAIKYALPDLGPMAQGALRSFGSTLLVGLYMLARSSKTAWVRGLGRPGSLAGFLFGAEFVLLYAALLYTDASRAVLFMYIAPFVVAIGSHLLFPAERLDGKAVVGIVLAFAGVVVSLNPFGESSAQTWFGDLLAVAGGIGWGLTTLVIRGTELKNAPASQVLLYQLAIAAAMFFVVGLVVNEPILVPMSGIAIASVLYQTVWVAAITYGIWFALIARYSATGLSVITFLTPVFGALMGYLLLDETLGVRHAVAVVAVAIGILLVTMPRRAGVKSSA